MIAAARSSASAGQDDASDPDPGVAVPDGEFFVWGANRAGPRSALLARELGMHAGARFLEDPGRRRRAAPVRYLRYAIAMLLVLLRRRPRIVFVQSPPAYAAWLAAAYARIRRGAFVIDAHSAAFQVAAWSRPRWVHERVIRAATAVLVTDPHWASQVERWGGRAIVVPDVPAVLRVGPVAPRERFTVAVVAAWSPDEPLREVFAAAAQVPGVDLVVTGAPRDVPVADLPPNVHLAGFLPTSDYYGLLASADAVMALTTRDHTMQRGACEAVSLGRPVITSDWPLLRDAFSSGTVFVDNTAASIANAIDRVRRDHERLTAEVAALRERRVRDWQAQRGELVAAIAGRLRSAA